MEVLKLLELLLLISLSSHSRTVSGRSLSNVLVENVRAEAGTNISIGCPGMTRNTFVVQLEWKCIGNCGAHVGSKQVNVQSTQDKEDGQDDSDDSEPQQKRLLKYVKDQETSVFAERLGLDKEMFALQFDPVMSQDNGKYLCLINNRPLPDAITKLTVLDVPDPPGQPMVLGFTSRSVKLSWTKPRRAFDEPITGYIITTG